jgi:hypothetical protein
MVNWFVNHEGSHLFMEPGEKSHLLGGHSHGHPHVHPHSPGLAQEGQPREVKTGGGFLASITGAIKRGLGMKERRAPTKLRPVTAVESLRPPATGRPASVASEYEMEDGYTRTQRQYKKLANRRSML